MAAVLGALGTMAFNAMSGREQYEQQHHMATHGLRHAAEDAERAGLNRVIALGSPAPATAGASFQAPDFTNAYNQTKLAEQQVATAKAQEDLLRSQADKTEAESSNIRTQTMIATEMLPVQKHQGVSQAEQATSQAELNQVNRLLQGLEHGKQEVLKSLYTEFGPMVLDVIRSIKDSFSNAKDANNWMDNLGAAFGAGGNSAKSVQGSVIDDVDAENIAQSVVRAVEDGKLNRSAIEKLSPKIRNHVYRFRPEWR